MGGRNSLARYEEVLNDVVGWLAKKDRRWAFLRFPYTKPEYGHPDPIPPERVARMHHVASRYHFVQKRRRALAFLIENTGLRRIEFHRMLVEHFWQQDAVLRLPRPAKHGKIRSIPLPKKTWHPQGPFMRYVRARRELVGTDEGQLWVNRFGCPMSPNTLWGEVEALGKAAGVKANFNRMRRTRATRLIERGVAIETLQELFGHASINSTRWYFELTPGLVRGRLEAAQVPGFA